MPGGQDSPRSRGVETHDAKKVRLLVVPAVVAASPLRARARVDGRSQPPRRGPQSEHALHAVECTQSESAGPWESVWSAAGMADGLPSHYSVRSDRSAVSDRSAIEEGDRYGAVTTDDDDDDEQPEGCLGGVRNPDERARVIARFAERAW